MAGVLAALRRWLSALVNPRYHQSFSTDPRMPFGSGRSYRPNENDPAHIELYRDELFALRTMRGLRENLEIQRDEKDKLLRLAQRPDVLAALAKIEADAAMLDPDYDDSDSLD